VEKKTAESRAPSREVDNRSSAIGRSLSWLPSITGERGRGGEGEVKSAGGSGCASVGGGERGPLDRDAGQKASK